MVQLLLIVDNLRSAHNVGALLRTADATGVDRVFVCGSTPYPRLPGDQRDPVVINRNTHEISKTALGAERTLKIEHYSATTDAITAARSLGCTIYGLEQSPNAANLLTFKPHVPAALVVGNEVEGLSAKTMAACDRLVEIPQRGSKESLNVAVAAGVALYQIVRHVK